MSARAALRLSGVAHIVGGVQVLDDIDLTIARGETLAVIGGSASGKTTLARLAGGLVAPSYGTVDILGARSTERTALAEVRPRVGMTLQGGSLFDELSVEDNLRLGAGATNIAAWRALGGRVDRLLYAFGLEEIEDRPVGALSVGAKRQLEIVRALLREPALLILDEPFEGAAAGAETMAHAISRSMRRHGGAVLLLTQDLGLAALLSERRLHLRNGRLVQQPAEESRPAARSSATPAESAASAI